MNPNTTPRPACLSLVNNQQRTLETFGERWTRRAITIPGTFALTCGYTVCLPLVALVAFVADLFLRRHGAVTRTALLLWVLFAMESAGIIAAFALWLARVAGLIQDPAAYQSAHYRLQRWWGSTLARAGQRLFRIRLEVENNYSFGQRPFILMLRHTSSVDTLLPVYLISRVHAVRFRYVLKRQLLWDPCLDIVGQRLPNVFVRPSCGARRNVAVLRELAAGAQSPNEGLLIYPEGTRFTPAKQARIRDEWDVKNPGAPGYVNTLQHVLPPRTAGAIALLQGNPRADAVFCVHAGFDGTATLGALMRGRLVGAVVRVFFFSVPAADIPSASDAQAQWLRDQWLRVDETVDRLIAASHQNC